MERKLGRVQGCQKAFAPVYHLSALRCPQPLRTGASQAQLTRVSNLRFAWSQIKGHQRNPRQSKLKRDHFVSHGLCECVVRTSAKVELSCRWYSVRTSKKPFSGTLRRSPDFGDPLETPEVDFETLTRHDLSQAGIFQESLSGCDAVLDAG
jgi:hypothetical protein